MECGDADQVVDGGGHFEPGPVAVLADAAEFASTANGFDPSEGFLDPFAFALTDVVAAVAGGARVDRRSSSAGVLSDVRGEPGRTDVSDEVLVS